MVKKSQICDRSKDGHENEKDFISGTIPGAGYNSESASGGKRR
jgi:hypothetical protein